MNLAELSDIASLLVAIISVVGAAYTLTRLVQRRTRAVSAKFDKEYSTRWTNKPDVTGIRVTEYVVLELHCDERLIHGTFHSYLFGGVICAENINFVGERHVYMPSTASGDLWIPAPNDRMRPLGAVRMALKSGKLNCAFDQPREFYVPTTAVLWPWPHN